MHVNSSKVKSILLVRIPQNSYQLHRSIMCSIFAIAHRVLWYFLVQITISICENANYHHIIGNFTLCPDYLPILNQSTSDQFLELPNHLLSPVYTRNNITNVQFRLNKNHYMCEGRETTRTTIEFSESKEIWNPSIPIFSPTGDLQLENEIYRNTEFCIQSKSSTEMDIVICNRTCDESDHVICLPKCCNMGQVFKLSDDSDFKCAFNGGIDWSPKIHSDIESKLNQSEIDQLIKQFYFHNPAPFCEENEEPEIVTLEGIAGTEDGTPFEIIYDGTIKIQKGGSVEWEILEAGTFCVDGAQHFDPQNQKFKDGLKMDTVLLHCTKSIVDFEPPKESVLYSCAMLVSATCLMITIIMNTVVPSLQKSYRWSLMSYFLSFFFMQVLLGTTRLLPYFQWKTIAYDYEEKPFLRQFCVGIGICAHFFCLMTFCWLTSINVEIWSTFRQTRLKTQGGLMKYCLQSVFALIVSVPIVITAVILENAYGDDSEHAWIVTPGYGQTTCFLEPIYASFYYLFLPIGLMIMTNTCLFFTTVFTIWKTKKNTQRVVKQSTQQNYSSIFVFLKLYLIMGIPWTFEFMLWAFTRHEKENPWYYQIIDILVTLQGVAILYIFCLSGETGRSLRQKYPRFKKLLTMVSICSCKSNSRTELDTVTGSKLSTGKMETSESSIGNKL